MNDTEAAEEITVLCPICNRTHTYPIDVDRSLIMYFEAPRDTTPKERSFTKLFICLKTGEDFQGTVTLLESVYERILDLTVRSPQDG
ncbi:MAG TPA: hypothetical protein VNL97_02475 [Solirubrobacterales bacterium]|nr:hypothetical protein [Solirubrobacterales bacterium]